LVNRTHRDVLGISEATHGPAERRPDLVQDRRGRDRVAQVRGQERHDLPADLQVRHIGVQVDPVQTLQIQRDLPVQDIVDRHRHRRRHDPQRERHPPA
jgi:hypothetical protein